MKKIILYHGSSNIIERPMYGKGKTYNDYGQGFYCTESQEMAKEWACTEGVDGFANQYELVTDDLKILYLTSEQYSVLHWLTVLLENRKLRLSTPIMVKGARWLCDHFQVPIDQYDVIVGYRADDSYFSFARAFLSNEISLQQLKYAMQLGKLGEQVVLKSPKAFQQLQFLSYALADNTVYYANRKSRDDAARIAYIKQLESEDINGIYIRDIIGKEMRANDSRLQ